MNITNNTNISIIVNDDNHGDEYINAMKNQMRQNSKAIRRSSEELNRKRSRWNEILEHGSVFQIADNYLSIFN